MLNIKAIIFDLDGTLLDTIDDISDSMNLALQQNGLRTFSVEEYKYFVGSGVDELIRNTISVQNADQSLHESLKKCYLDNYARRQHIKTKPYPGIQELLKNLDDLGLIVNVLSNKPDHDTQTVINYYFPNIKFGRVYGKRPGYLVKPNPLAVNEMISELQISKTEVLYVGDTYTDMMTAKNAGLISIGVLWGFRKVTELQAGDAKYIVTNPEEILAIVKEGTQYGSIDR
ncbi:MAG: HAD family hydrolase [Candidatus Izemoplasmatales bacterium]|nr:HAD family hydrolase [Candidatus Izemoplasmatales bacterium]MDD4595162.1 HAD family hydrolase [Candidatus Izemoplasmatales bacterium]